MRAISGYSAAGCGRVLGLCRGYADPAAERPGHRAVHPSAAAKLRDRQPLLERDVPGAELAALADGAFGPDAAAVAFDDPLEAGQADASTRKSVTACSSVPVWIRSAYQRPVSSRRSA